MSCFEACETSAAASCVAECAAEIENPPEEHPVIFDVLGALGLLCLSGLFSGLTLGLMSLDIQQLEITIAGGTPLERRQAERILPIRKRGNLLLCTLLIGNTVVNAFIAILMSSFTGGAIGTLLSTAFILIFGEILPQSICSRYGLAAGSKAVEIVQVITALLFFAAWPISRILDRVLGEGALRPAALSVTIASASSSTSYFSSSSSHPRQPPPPPTLPAARTRRPAAPTAAPRRTSLTSRT